VLNWYRKRRRLLHLGTTTTSHESYYDPEEREIYRGLTRHSVFGFRKMEDRDVVSEVRMLNNVNSCEANYTVEEIKHGDY